jgi:hypothetical protein
MKSAKLLIVITLALGLLTLNSCKKDKQETVIHFTASINGTATTFDTEAAAIVSNSQGNTLTTLKGTAKDGTILTISIAGTPIVGKTYSDAEANDDDRPLMLITPPGDADSFFNYDDDASNLPAVTINSANSTTVTGTFKGTLTGGVTVGGGNNFPKKVITNGKFSLNYAK